MGHQVALWWHAWRGEGICRLWSKVFKMYCSGLAVPPTSWRGAIWQENQGHRNSDMGFSVLLGTLRGYLMTLQQAFLGQDTLCSSRLPRMACQLHRTAYHLVTDQLSWTLHTETLTIPEMELPMWEQTNQPSEAEYSRTHLESFHWKGRDGLMPGQAVHFTKER